MQDSTCKLSQLLEVTECFIVLPPPSLLCYKALCHIAFKCIIMYGMVRYMCVYQRIYRFFSGVPQFPSLSILTGQSLYRITSITVEIPSGIRVTTAENIERTNSKTYLYILSWKDLSNNLQQLLHKVRYISD